MVMKGHSYPAIAPGTRRHLLALMALATLQACSTPATEPKQGVVIRPGPGPATPPPVTEQRRLPGTAQPVIPVPGAEKADIRTGDKLWYRGGEGNARPNTILREVTGIQNGFVLYRQVGADNAGKPNGPSRLRRQSLGSLELDNPGKATGQVRYVDFPLGLGKTWSYRYQLKSKSGALSTYDIVARVEAEEVISTPAGNFKALRILHGGQWNVPVVEGSNVKVSTGSLRSTLWFAPAIGNWVKFESEILNANGALEAKVYQELIRFERRNAP